MTAISIEPELGQVDPSSFSNPDNIKVTHISLFWNIDFSQTLISGEVHLTCERKGNDNFLVLDTRDLKISQISDLATNQKLEFTLGDNISTFGSYLKIKLPLKEEPQFKICIKYETSSSASALQWLTPEQTLGKQEPFMFSQCQAIHCRSIIPCQDTPSVKCTYTAEVTAPKQLLVLMSAVKDGEGVLNDDKTLMTWKFEQKIPIPSYLIAIAAGRLKPKLLALKSTVYAEPEIIKDCFYEFGETESMLKAASQICGPYVWGRYDLLVLPPSFPFGGMENPCLTFVTPTLLAGDRSLANVVAHEIAHSWTGNLVTNATFEHFWLNEGFTTFVERKIQGLMFGEEHRHFHALQGLEALTDTVVQTLGEDNPLTCLVPNLKNVDPDDAFSTVPYEKGHTLLFYLEELVGQEGMFDEYLKNYLEKFKFQSITTDDFKKSLYEFFISKRRFLNEVDWDAWFHSPGMPPVIPNYNRSLVEVCEQLAQRWVEWRPSENCMFGASPFDIKDISSFSSGQKCVFFNNLVNAEPLEIEKLRHMREIYQLIDTKNSELKFRWFRLCIKAKWNEQVPEIFKFINEQGRMKFVRPIYRDLYNWEEVRPLAIQNFEENRPYMMFVSANQLEKDLHLNEVINEEV